MEEAAQIAIKADPLAVLSFIFHLALILVFMVPYVSAQFNPGGKTFSTSFGMSETSGILLTAFAVTIVQNQVSFLESIIYELVPAFSISALLTVIISLLTAAPESAEKELKTISARYRR